MNPVVCCPMKEWKVAKHSKDYNSQLIENPGIMVCFPKTLELQQSIAHKARLSSSDQVSSYPVGPQSPNSSLML